MDLEKATLNPRLKPVCIWCRITAEEIAFPSDRSIYVMSCGDRKLHFASLVVAGTAVVLHSNSMLGSNGATFDSIRHWCGGHCR